MKNRRMRTRMYGGVRGRKTKKVGRNSKIFVFLLLDLYPSGVSFQHQAQTFAFPSKNSHICRLVYHGVMSRDI